MEDKHKRGALHLTMGLRVSLAVILLFAAGCAHDKPNLYGSYEIVGQAGGVSAAPVATLEIVRPDRYSFCQAGHCSAGKYTLLPIPSAAHGRITFAGAQVEDFVLGVSAAAYGQSDVARQRGKQGFIDLDYTLSKSGTEIQLGVGDIAFIKR